MSKLAQGLVGLLRKFVRRQNGVAAVEFALVVPVMLSVYLGCSEAATLLTADRKVQSVAGAVGDLVARSNKVITEAQIKDYFEAARSIMVPYNSARLVQTVTAVAVSSTGTSTVTWSVRYSGGTLSKTVADHAVGSTYKLPKEMVDIAKGQTVIAAETSYGYTPLLGVVFKNELDLRRSALFMPRFGGTIALN
jgi:Flp pilus assembly protein TadG